MVSSERTFAELLEDRWRIVMKKMVALALTFVVGIAASNSGLGDTIFQDDFEDDKLGEPPDRWIGCPEEGPVAEDPEDSSNKVMFLKGGADADCAVIADTDDLSEYTAEWDWLWTDGGKCHSFSIHWQGRGEYYHFSRRTDGISWGIWARTGGAWPGPFVNGAYAWELSKWYRLQVNVSGSDISGKIKERDDGTPFDEIEPFIEMRGNDDRFDKGKFGPNEGWSGAYIDNVLIYIGEFSKAVERDGKLASTWGEVKRLTISNL